MSEEERGFVIRDRRGRGESEDSGTSTSGQSATPQPGKQSEASQRQEEAEPMPHAAPNFLSFVYSLGTSALMLLGENPAQEAPGITTNLGHAQEIIDILTILEVKTKGNLTEEEETLLQEMLYTLRVKYVEKASASKP
jgi:uncharacterized protein DUF1844